jgi:adenosylcobinamide-phosphate guanylyltransferase
MGVTAIIMAGGKGKRMGLSGEKPLFEVGGKPAIAHVIESLQASKKVDSIVVAVTNHAPKTANFVSQFPVKVVKTPGKEYIFDMQYVVKKLKLEKVLTIAADLPLITSEIIDSIVEDYEQCGKPALAVVVPIETKMKLGMSEEYAFTVNDKLMVPTGINMIDGRRIEDEELEQEIYVCNREEVAVNVNTVQELGIAENLFKKQFRN